MKDKRLPIKAVSIIMTVALIIGCIPMMASAEDSSIHLGLLSDIHYFPDSLKGNGCKAFTDFSDEKGKEYTEANSLLANALDGIKRNASEEKPNYVIIPGDLTKDGEYEGHVELAGKLEAFEEETGIPVFVINGNHDVNNSNVNTFADGKKAKGRKTSPEDFREIYKNLGYDLAIDTFIPKAGNKGGMLSYTADLGESFRLIAVDGCIYSADNGSGSGEHLTDGNIGDDLLGWITEMAAKAKSEGRIPVVMQHHNVIPHMEIEEATFFAFVVPDWQRIADTYADAGIHYVFTGHLHASDTISYVSDNGETITDILTPTLTGYPNYYRTVDMTTDGSDISLDMTNYDIDEYQPVVSDSGYEYPKPYRLTGSFVKTFGGADIEDFLEGLLGSLIGDIFKDIQKTGGLVKYLAAKNLDLEKIITDAIGMQGLAIGNVDILTVRTNVMGFINDFGKQVDDVYINQPDATMEKVMAILHKLLSFETSSYPCTYNSKILGGEAPEHGCTLGEFATSVILAFYNGDEDILELPYVADTLEGFDSGAKAEEFFNLLRTTLINDLIEDELLSNLDFNPGELFPDGTALALLGNIIQGITEQLLGGNNSFMNLIDSVLGISLVPDGYHSIDEILDTLVVDEYLTFSQFESWGGTIAWMVGSLIKDENPAKASDNNISLTYTGPVEVEATKENFRLPSNVVMTLGEDSSTQATITWISKYSLEETDIELIPFSENPEFTGRPTTDGRVETLSVPSERFYPGADLGIIGFLDYGTDYIQHTVKLKNLTPATKYSFRVGNAEKGWWSENGTIETAGGNSEAFTFFHITDPQGQRASQYERYASVIETAKEAYPEAKFVVSSGDQVDMGKNSKYWNYFLNSTDMFLNMPFMPTTGNHEKEGSVLTTNFVLPNVPEQNLDTGVYYSYDYNGVHFSVLNTNDDAGDKLGEEQINWLINDVQKSDADWKIVVLHKALYSNGSHYDDKEVKGMRGQLSALLPYLGVDLVLQGHDHVYLRTDAMNSNAVMPSRSEIVKYNGLDFNLKKNPSGTLYSICGTSGVKVYSTKDEKATDKLFPRAETIVNSDKSMFSAITVDGNRLYYSAYQVEDGEAERVDNFAIEKTGSAPSDKIGGGLSTAFAKLLSKVNLKPLWKIINFFTVLFGRILNMFSK